MSNEMRDFTCAQNEWWLLTDAIDRMIDAGGSVAAAWSVAGALVELAHKALGHEGARTPEQAWEAQIVATAALERNDQTARS